MKSSLSRLVGTRRSIVLSLSRRYGFPAGMDWRAREVLLPLPSVKSNGLEALSNCIHRAASISIAIKRFFSEMKNHLRIPSFYRSWQKIRGSVSTRPRSRSPRPTCTGDWFTSRSKCAAAPTPVSGNIWPNGSFEFSPISTRCPTTFVMSREQDH